MKFEDVKVGDIYGRSDELRFVVVWRTGSEFHVIYHGGSMLRWDRGDWDKFGINWPLISRNKTVTVSVK